MGDWVKVGPLPTDYGVEWKFSIAIYAWRWVPSSIHPLNSNLKALTLTLVSRVIPSNHNSVHIGQGFNKGYNLYKDCTTNPGIRR